MAFTKSSNFSIHGSTFIDNSNITRGALMPDETRRPKGNGIQILFEASSMDAVFDSAARHPPPLCHPSTRKGLLEYILKWAEAGEEKILFLDGPAGAGKTAIAQAVAKICADKKMLWASYFFFRGSPSRNTITHLIPTIIYQIVISSSRKRNKMNRVIGRDPSILDKSPSAQVERLIPQVYQPPFFRWNIFSKPKCRLLIIDGLDECAGDNNQQQIVNLLARLVDNKHLIVRCLIVSRPEPHILSAIGSLPMKIAHVNSNEDSWDTTGDVQLYLRSRFAEIAGRMPLSIPRPWPSDEVIEILVQKTGGTFIYASTVLNYVDDPDSLPTTQLEHVLALSPGPRPFAELDRLYEHILMACPARHHSTLLHIFGFIFLQNPAFEEAYDVSLIEAILKLPPGEVTVVLRRMHSILIFTTNDSKHTIRFLHASFGDFLFNQRRSGCFYIDCQKEHLFLATMCINYLGYCTEGGFDRSSVENTHMLYAWNSWPYHGAASGSISPVDFVDKLSRCDKNLWAKIIFHDTDHRSCMDKLKDGISWLQTLNNKVPVDALVHGLTSMRWKLEEQHYSSGLANMTTPPTMFRIVEVAFNCKKCQIFQI